LIFLARRLSAPGAARQTFAIFVLRVFAQLRAFVLQIPAPTYQQAGIMDHRERILAAINHQPVDRVPTDMWATVEVQENLFAHFGIDAAQGTDPGGVALLGGKLTRDVAAILELWERLEVDGILMIMPPYIGPPLPEDGDLIMNEWGMGSRRQVYATGTYEEQVVYPLAAAETIADLDAYQWPDPGWYDYDALPGLAARCGGRAICCGYTAPFYYHNMLRGLELSLMDPILRPEFAQHLVGRISDFFTEFHRRCYEALGGRADLTQVTDDFGSQNGLLIGPRVFDRFYRAALQRGFDLAKAYGLKVFHHDDGDMRGLLPRLAGMGIEILNPIQWRCGEWDLGALKAEYGSCLCFHSAVDNQQTLPFGTPAEVREQVRMLIGTLASDRTGYILGPCHNLQANTPVENIIAMYEAAPEYGGF
jgi:uroporphyrinogen decarboxylase